MKYVKNLFVFLLTLVLVSSVASALPVTIDKFELDGVELTPDSTTRLDLERDMEYPVKIMFTPTGEGLKNAEFTLFISGYEYSHYQKIADSTRTDDYDAGVTYTERMTLELPSDMEVGNEKDENGNTVSDYTLRLLITDKNGIESVFNYYIKVDTVRHKLDITDVILSPAGQIESGRALYANIRVENNGRMDERDVKVTFSIPELGVKTSAYIEDVEAGEEEELEDGVTLLLPDCAEEKEYAVQVAVLYDNKHKEDVAEDRVWVVPGSKCKAAEPTPVVVTPVEGTVEPVANTGKLRSALEVALLVLVGLLVVIGLIIGFSKLGSKDEF